MQYKKLLHVKEIHEESKEFSTTALGLRDFMVINHCRFHDVPSNRKQEISGMLNIPIGNYQKNYPAEKRNPDKRKLDKKRKKK